MPIFMVPFLTEKGKPRGLGHAGSSRARPRQVCMRRCVRELEHRLGHGEVCVTPAGIAWSPVAAAWFLRVAVVKHAGMGWRLAATKSVRALATAWPPTGGAVRQQGCGCVRWCAHAGESMRQQDKRLGTPCVYEDTARQRRPWVKRGSKFLQKKASRHEGTVTGMEGSSAPSPDSITGKEVRPWRMLCSPRVAV